MGFGDGFFLCAHPEQYWPLAWVQNWALMLLEVFVLRSLLGKARSGRQTDISTTFSPANPILYISLARKDWNSESLEIAWKTVFSLLKRRADIIQAVWNKRVTPSNLSLNRFSLSLKWGAHCKSGAEKNPLIEPGERRSEGGDDDDRRASCWNSAVNEEIFFFPSLSTQTEKLLF